SESEQFATKTLRNLLKHPNLSLEQVWQTAQSLYQSSPEDSESEQFAIETLRNLLEHPDLSLEQAWQTAQSLYQSSKPGDSESGQFATEILRNLLERPDLSLEQTRQTAMFLYQNSPIGSEQEYFATKKLLSLVQRYPLTADWDRVYRILQRMIPQFTRLGTHSEP
ncbi:MAG TPA: hypothetical protein VHV10_15255, partial [Ktedonobacteraceae bacterium]|nr:hypothetical protein [Ktedonobacteraceae bacterium]